MTARKVALKNDDRKSLADHLVPFFRVLGLVAILTATMLVLFSLIWSMLGQLPWALKLFIGSAAIVLIFICIGMLVSRVKLPNRWLLAVAGGILILASPLLMLSMHGSWESTFEIPNRTGRASKFSVLEFTWVAVALGITALIYGGVGYARSPLRKQRALVRRNRGRTY